MDLDLDGACCGYDWTLSLSSPYLALHKSFGLDVMLFRSRDFSWIELTSEEKSVGF